MKNIQSIKNGIFNAREVNLKVIKKEAGGSLERTLRRTGTGGSGGGETDDLARPWPPLGTQPPEPPASFQAAPRMRNCTAAHAPAPGHFRLPLSLYLPQLDGHWTRTDHIVVLPSSVIPNLFWTSAPLRIEQKFQRRFPTLFHGQIRKVPDHFIRQYFVPMTSRNWNSLPASIFPSTYNFQTFKTRVHKNLLLHPLFSK